jgi:hypothetical protein
MWGGTRLETASLTGKLSDYMDGKDADTQPGTQALGACSPAVARAVTLNTGTGTSERAAGIDESHGLTPAVAMCHNEPLNSIPGFDDQSSPVPALA